MKVIYLCGSTPVCMLPTHHVTTKGLFHLVTNFELEEGSNTSTLSPGEICHSVAEALLTFLGLEHIFQWQPSQLCAALSKVQDVLNLIFYWPRICHFSGTPFHKQCLVLCCHPTTPEPPAAVFLGKAQAIQNVPSDVSKGPWRGWRQAHSAVGHCHALKWLGWSPGITVGCRPPPSGASSLPAEEGAVARWPQPAPASGARPGPEVCSAAASATACSLCMAASIYTSNWTSCAGYGSDVTTTKPAEP